ncbi:MAG: hypothetical protein ACRD0C_16665, partial [Acidimicrobiia bacterium]
LRLARARVRLARFDLVGARADAEAALAAGAGVEGLEVAGWVAYYGRDHDAARRYADEGVARAADPALRASCLALAGRHRHARGELAGAESCLVEATAGPAPVRPVAQIWLGALRAHQGRPDEAGDLVGRGLVDPGAIGHPFAPLHGLFVRCHAAGIAGRLDLAFRAASDLAAEVARQSQQASRFRPVVQNLRAWLLRATGQWSAADDASAEALELGAAIDFGEPGAHAVLDLADGRLRAGDDDGAARWLTQASDMTADDQATMVWHQRQRLAWLRGRLALAAGDPATAAAEAAGLVTDARSRGTRRYELLGRALAALAGDGTDHEAIEALLGELDRVAAPEAWWVTAELAAARDVDRWRSAAERRASVLVSAATGIPGIDADAVGRALRAELDRAGRPR